jgi:hypothetical protein
MKGFLPINKNNVKKSLSWVGGGVPHRFRSQAVLAAFPAFRLATLARLAACLFPLLMKARYLTERSLSVLLMTRPTTLILLLSTSLTLKLPKRV